MKTSQKTKIWIGITVIGLISVTSLIRTFCFSQKDNVLSTSTIMIPILAVLVTVLIGWQIFNVISLDDRFQKLKDEMLFSIEQAKQLLRKESNCATSVNTSVYLYERQQYQDALNCLINGMKSAIDLNSNDHVNTIIINLVAIIKAAAYKKKELTISSEDKLLLKKGVIFLSSSINVENYGNVKIDNEEVLKLIDTI